MPSVFTHAVAAVALGRAYAKPKLPFRFWLLSAGCAIAPDMDVMGRRLGIEYSDMLGHRGLSHSLLFAAILSGLIVLLAFRRPIAGISRRMLFLLFFLATASHGILDAMVDGTLGVAFFAPFDAGRFFLPWRPIVSSPIGWSFFSAAGVTTIMNEFVWIWIPSLIVIMAPWLSKRATCKREEENAQSPQPAELQKEVN
jgi:inner membrane protein